MRADKKLLLLAILLVISVSLLAILNYLSFCYLRYNGKTDTALLKDGQFTYTIYLKPKTWNDALYSCYALESRLAEYYVEKAQIRLNSIIMKCNATSDKAKISGYWLGGKHNGSEWKWSASGLPVPRDGSANKWGWGDTVSSNNVKGTENDCIELRFANKSDVPLVWRSVKCKEVRPYICQRPHFV